MELARKYGDRYQRTTAKAGWRRAPGPAHAHFSRGLSAKQATAEARAELGLAEGGPADAADRARLEARAQEIVEYWQRVRRSPPLPECWHRRHGGFVREALGPPGDGAGGAARHVPVACLLEWARTARVVDRAAGRRRALYGGRRRVPTDAVSVLEALADLSDATSLYRIPLVTPHAVARRDGDAGAGARVVRWTVRIGVYMNRLLPEVLTLGSLHCVMSALDEGSFVVREPLHLPPSRPCGDPPVFHSAKYPIVRLSGVPCDDGGSAEEEKKEDDGMRQDPTVRGSTVDQKTISAFTPKGLLKLMESSGNDVTQFPEIARALSPYLKLDLMLHQQHAVCWMTQMEHLGGFGINSILWEEREFLDGGKYYYSPALGQLRLSRPPVALGGCIADEMGLGKTLSLVSLVASSLAELKQEAREGGGRCTHATLIIVPPALVMQWCNEVRKSCGESLMVVVLDANRLEIESDLVTSGGEGSDILVTTYSALEKPKTSRWLSSWKWGRVALDEQQEIRSSTTKIAKNCESLESKRRWMLSGTPIFEGVEDLRGELNFLRLTPYAAKYEDGFFDFSIMNHWKLHSQHALETLKILSLLILRRSKDMTLSSGQSIMEQRKLTVTFKEVPQSDSERALYCWFEYLVSWELQRKNDDANPNRSLKSRALCLRLLREICFSAVMINGGLGVTSQIRTLNELLRKGLRNEQQHKQTEKQRTKKRNQDQVLSCDGALRFLSQHQRNANISDDFVSEQQFRGGGGATARAHATENIHDQVKRAKGEIDRATKKICDARRKRAKAFWHLALELITTGNLCQSPALLSRVSPKFTFLWQYRRTCIERKEREDINIVPVLQRGWRPPPSFLQEILTSYHFDWAHKFVLRLSNIPPQVSMNDIASAILSSSRKEPGARMKLQRLKTNLEKVKDDDHLRIRTQSDIKVAEKTLEEAISYDCALQSPAVIEILQKGTHAGDMESRNWSAYVKVSGEEVQQQLIRQAKSTKGIVLKNAEAIPSTEAALAHATKLFSQVDAEYTVHPSVENKKKKAEARKALEKAKLGLTINFDSLSSGSVQNVVLSQAFRGLRGEAPRSSSALVSGAHDTIMLAKNDLVTSSSLLKDSQSTLTRLTRLIDKDVNQYIQQTSAYDILQSLRKKDFDATRCALCLEPLGSNSIPNSNKSPVVSMISCGHFFCIPCLDRHIHTEIGKNKDVTCPICRKDFTPSSDVMHIDHLANDNKDNDDKRNRAKEKVLEASEILENSEGVLLDGDLWNHLYLSIDVPSNVSNEPHHVHTALPRDVLAHIRAATQMKVDCGKSAKPLSWGMGEESQNSTAGISSKIRALLHDLPLREHSVVFSSSKESVIHLATIIKAKAIHCFSLYTGQDTTTSEKAVACWSSMKTDESKAGPVLVVQAGAAASGLTLTAASRLFLMEPFPRQEEEQQAYARLHRYGQKKDVHVTVYYAPVSVESRLLFWRKKYAEKIAEGSSTSYVYMQPSEEEDEDFDHDDADMIHSVSMSEKDEEEAPEEPTEDNLRTQFLLGLVDADGNSTTRGTSASRSAPPHGTAQESEYMAPHTVTSSHAS